MQTSLYVLTYYVSVYAVGEDFELLTQQLTFGPDDESMNVSLLILNDDVVEEEETLQLVLSGAEGERAAQVAEGGVVTGTIIDDDDGKLHVIGICETHLI